MLQQTTFKRSAMITMKRNVQQFLWYSTGVPQHTRMTWKAATIYYI